MHSYSYHFGLVNSSISGVLNEVVSAYSCAANLTLSNLCLMSAALSPSGHGATCVSISPQEAGGLGFHCRQCNKPGYQPFAGTRAVSFWLKPNSGTSDPFVSSTPNGQVRG